MTHLVKITMKNQHRLMLSEKKEKSTIVWLDFQLCSNNQYKQQRLNLVFSHAGCCHLWFWRPCALQASGEAWGLAWKILAWLMNRLYHPFNINILAVIIDQSFNPFTSTTAANPQKAESGFSGHFYPHSLL